MAESALNDYEAIKEAMLETLGDTPASADHCWWTLSRRSGEDIGAFYLRVHSTWMRRIHGLKSQPTLVSTFNLIPGGGDNHLDISWPISWPILKSRWGQQKLHVKWQ